MLLGGDITKNKESVFNKGNFITSALCTHVVQVMYLDSFSDISCIIFLKIMVRSHWILQFIVNNHAWALMSQKKQRWASEVNTVIKNFHKINT